MNLLVILFAPLIGSIIIWLLLAIVKLKSSNLSPTKLFSKGVPWIATIAVFCSCLAILKLFFHIPTSIETLSWMSWFGADDTIHTISFTFTADALTLAMLSFIGGIGFFIHLYSIAYMRNDKEGMFRYFATLNLFMFFMFLLVLSNNLLVLFVGWEGVGFCSYALIGHYYYKPEAIRSANKAFIMNRLGDAFFLAGIFSVLWLLGTADLQDINQSIRNGTLLSQQAVLIGSLLFLGACGKSAQFPLLTWLPNAMTGPTPVSALIHAATMVTAGVYLVLRLSALFLSQETLVLILLTFGLLTMLIGSIGALRSVDIKRILAYSTISQLGFIFAGFGLGSGESSFLHLYSHSFFKGLLFLSAGFIIYYEGGKHHEQHIYKLRELISARKTPLIIMIIGSLALSGIFPMNGFFSKSAILQLAEQKSYSLWILFEFMSIFTIIYATRLWMVLFWKNGAKLRPSQQKYSWHMLVALWSLVALTILSAILVLLPEFSQLMHLPIPNLLTEFFSNNQITHQSNWLFISESIAISTLTLLATMLYYHLRLTSQSTKSIELSKKAKQTQEMSVLDHVYYYIWVVPLHYTMHLSKMLDRQIFAGIQGLVTVLETSGNVCTRISRKVYSGLLNQFVIVLAVIMLLVLIWEVLLSS